MITSLSSLSHNKSGQKNLSRKTKLVKTSRTTRNSQSSLLWIIITLISCFSSNNNMWMTNAQLQVPTIEEGEGFEVDMEPFTMEVDWNNVSAYDENNNDQEDGNSVGNLEDYLAVAMREQLPNLFGVLLYLQTGQDGTYYTGMALFKGPPFRSNYQVVAAQQSALETFHGTFVDVSAVSTPPPPGNEGAAYNSNTNSQSNEDGTGSGSYDYEMQQQQQLDQQLQHPWLYPKEPPFAGDEEEDASGNAMDEYYGVIPEYDSSSNLRGQQNQTLDNSSTSEANTLLSNGGGIAMGCTFGILAMLLLAFGYWFHQNYRCVRRSRHPAKKNKKKKGELGKNSNRACTNAKDKHSDCGSEELQEGSDDGDDEDEVSVVDFYIEDDEDDDGMVVLPTKARTPPRHHFHKNNKSASSTKTRHRRARSTLPEHQDQPNAAIDDVSGHRRWNSIGAAASDAFMGTLPGVSSTSTWHAPDPSSQRKRPSMVDLLAMMEDESENGNFI